MYIAKTQIIQMQEAFTAHPYLKNEKQKERVMKVLNELNHPPRPELVRNELIIVHTGQAIKSIREWAETLGEGIDATKNLFKDMEAERFIMTDLFNNVTRVTLLASPFFTMKKLVLLQVATAPLMSNISASSAPAFSA